jgi:hypothetical protein
MSVANHFTRQYNPEDSSEHQSQRSSPTFKRCSLPQFVIRDEDNSTYETSFNIYQTIRCNVPENNHLHSSPWEPDILPSAPLWGYSMLRSQILVALMMEAVRNSETSVISPGYKAQHPRKQPTSYSSPWEPEISLSKFLWGPILCHVHRLSMLWWLSQ